MSQPDPPPYKKGKPCKKVHNPCKICLQTVKPGSGVQCQGACEAWVHFECLNYTPGKIKDIKKGFITITCPCPDCKTTVPKEYRNSEPFACNNVQCPANNPPCCETFDCQANEMYRCKPAKCPPPGTLRNCDANVCRDYSRHPNAFKSSPDDPCMEGHTLKTYCGENYGKGTKVAMLRLAGEGGSPVLTDECGRTYSPTLLPERPCKDIQTTLQPVKGPVFPGQGVAFPQQQGEGAAFPQQQGQGGMFPQPGQYPAYHQQGRQGPNSVSPETVQQICKTVGYLANQLNVLMDSLKGFGPPGRPGGPGGQQHQQKQQCHQQQQQCHQQQQQCHQQQQQQQGGMKACGSGGQSCGGNAGCTKCKRGNNQLTNCSGGCGPPGQSDCATGCVQPCFCPGNPNRK